MTSEKFNALLKAADADDDTFGCYHVQGTGYFCPVKRDCHHGIDHQYISLYDLLREVAGMDSGTDGLVIALRESVKLQAHYAELLNIWDGGKRMIFKSSGEWIARLKETGTIPTPDRRTEEKQ